MAKQNSAVWHNVTVNRRIKTGSRRDTLRVSDQHFRQNNADKENIVALKNTKIKIKKTEYV